MKILFLIIPVILILTSCYPEYGESGYTKHIYLNSSSHIIVVKSYKWGKLQSGMKLSIQQEEDYNCWGEGGTPDDEPRYITQDSVVVVFNNRNAIAYEWDDIEGNPMHIANYELLEAEKEPYIYLFEFTNEDYQRAVDKGRIIN